MRVMIVDDERPCLDELEYLIKGYSDIVITGAYDNPLEALPALGFSPPDAVFLDIGMPHLSGIELAERIHDLDESILVVFISAHARLLAEAKKTGPFESILKPVSIMKLNAVVEKLRTRVRQTLP